MIKRAVLLAWSGLAALPVVLFSAASGWVPLFDGQTLEEWKAGVEFTLGTNNAGREIFPNRYGLRMVRECGLPWQDRWMPKADGQKPVQVCRPGA